MPEPDANPTPPRPGTNPSAPSASHYAVELPYAEELQAMLEGRYLVESFLGQGGMGAVYKGLQMPLKRPVAIKILQKKQAGAEEDEFAFEERFKREAYAMAALTHPHIVQVYDCGDAGENFLFISMELVQGGDLSDALKAGKITPEVALKLIPQICDGLQAAHDRGIVHRDIKPANIFLTSDGRAKVADFGLAKKFDVKSTFVTKSGLGMGTPDYAAPEQYEPELGIDHRADIYALGVMMYQMLTGRLPRGVYKMPSQLVPGLDPRIDDVVARAMANEREERWQNASEIKEALQQITAQPSKTTTAPRASVPASTSTRTSAVPVAATRTSAVPARPTSPQITRPTAVAGKKIPSAEPTSPPKKSRAGLIAIVFGAVALAAVGAFFVMKKPAADSSGRSDQAISTAVDDAFMREVAAAPAERQVELVKAKIEAINGKPVGVTPTITGGKLTGLDFNRVDQNTITDFSPLAALKDLKVLRIMYLNPTDLSFLRGLRLDKLTIHGGTYTNIDVLRGLPLIFLELRGGAVQNFSALAGMRLNRLDLAGSRVGDLNFVKGMPLAYLQCDGTAVTDLSPLRGLPLTTIKADIVPARDAEILRSIPTLRTINDRPADEFWRSVGVASAQPPSTSPSELTFGGHRYQIVPDNISWREAKKKAEAMGGHLATITTRAEDDFLIASIKDRIISGWIGLSRESNAAEWKWVTGEPRPFSHWGPGQPDASGTFDAYARYWIRDGKMMGWDDSPGSDTRQPGYIVEWDDTGSTPPVATSASAPISGAINLLAQVDTNRDTVGGDWKMVNGELMSNGGFARLAFTTYQPPAEYDFRTSFTRKGGDNAVGHHLTREGRDIMWLMGGFKNSVWAFEQVGGANGDANPTTIKSGLENGRRYESVVKVRRDRVLVEVDGKQVSEFKSDGSEWGTNPLWTFPDKTRLGVGCQNGTVFHKIEVVPFGGSASPVAGPAPVPPPPPPISGGTPKVELPPAPVTPKQIIDLIGLLDLTRDRVQAGASTGANDWQKTGNVLTYKSDGKSGKVFAPVSLAGVRDYEVGVILRRLSGTDPISLDLPVSATNQSTLDISARGIELGLEKGRRQKIGEWPKEATGDLRLLARVRFAADGRYGSVTVTINNVPAGQWEGALADMGKPLAIHPDFPSDQMLSIYCYKDSFAFATWQLRIYDGEARMLRGAGVAAKARSAPVVAVASPDASKAAQKLFDGKTLDGWRIGGDPAAFVVEDKCIKATGAKGNLIYTGADGKASWTDFDLSMKVKTGSKANSGVFIHCDPTGLKGGQLGMEMQIANDGNGDPQKSGSVWSISPVNEVHARDNEWFDYRIVVKGKQVTSFIDRKKVADWTQPDDWKPPGNVASARLGQGTIAIQSNQGVVWIKDIELKTP